MRKLIITTALSLCLLLSTVQTDVYAQEHGHEHEGHAHGNQHKAHDGAKGHAHNDDDKGDRHGHGGQDDHHDDHGHDGHEEGQTEISSDAANHAGIVVEKATAREIKGFVSLTGRIVIDQNRRASVRARFPGVVRSVNVNWGDVVKKGQGLAIIESNESLQNYTVAAPIDGVVLERNTNMGDVANDNALFMIADLSQVWAKFHVFPKDAEIINVAQDVRVRTLDNDKVGKAPIDMLFPTADALSQTMIAIVPLPNEGGVWRPGMTVEGDVNVSTRQVPVAARVSAIQTMEDKQVVFVRDGQTYKPVPVKTGVNDGEYIEITEGLAVGQDYVSDGSFIIKADILKAGAAHQH